MLAVVGLGNPGGEYEKTRHNVGYRLVDELAGGKGVFERKGTYLFLGTKIIGRRVLLVKPVTYMNLSGDAMSDLLGRSGMKPSEALVVSDDVNLPIGRIRMRARGGDGGQKGLASIIDELGTGDFPRLRLGIGPRPEERDLADFVLEPFGADEEPVVDGMMNEAARAVREWVRSGIRLAMERYNSVTSPDGGKNEDEASHR